MSMSLLGGRLRWTDDGTASSAWMRFFAILRGGSREAATSAAECLGGASVVGSVAFASDSARIPRAAGRTR